MAKGMEILYNVHSGLYVNLTNRCPCACTFCLRQNMETVGESASLWLEREPSAEEVIAEREEALAAELAAQRRKKSKLVDPLQ